MSYLKGRIKDICEHPYRIYKNKELCIEMLLVIAGTKELLSDFPQSYLSYINQIWGR